MRMDDSQLRTAVSAEIKSSIGYIGSEISSVRADNLKRYLGDPYGDELDGRSKVVMSDAMDTVEWIMPSLMRIFMSSDDAVEFVPTGPEDEDGAKQATEYCNYVFMQENPGFMNTLTVLKDGLIEKTGVFKVWWDDSEKWERESYSSLSELAYSMILSDPAVEVVEHTETGSVSIDQMGQPVEEKTHDVVIKRRQEYGCVKIEPVPSDEFLISRDGKGIQEARFVGHKREVTKSDLIAEGYSKDIIDRLGVDSGAADTEEDYVRNSVEHEYETDNVHNDAMREVTVIECYIRVDYDGDGIAEMRKVTVAGEAHEVLDNVEWDGMRPFSGWSPIPLPHRFYGLSVVDLVKDLQRIRTTIMRQYLDSLYQANVPVYEVNVEALVDQTGGEVMNRVPGSTIRKRGMEPALTAAPTSFIGETAIQGLSVVDQMRENRTGVSQKTMGLAPDALHDTKGGQELLFTAAMGRIELIARVYAEVCLRDVFKIILELLNRYQDKPKTIRLRNSWVQMDPRSWREGMDLTVNVGLGNGNQEKQAAMLGQVMGLMERIVQAQGGVSGPLVDVRNIYNAAKKLTEAAGFKDTDQFFNDPEGQQPQQPKQSPEERKAMMDAKVEEMKASKDHMIEMAKLQVNAELKREEMALDMRLQREKAAAELELQRERMQTEAALKVAQPTVRMGGDIG